MDDQTDIYSYVAVCLKLMNSYISEMKCIVFICNTITIEYIVVESKYIERDNNGVELYIHTYIDIYRYIYKVYFTYSEIYSSEKNF
jgi:hypothetical protein